MKILVDEYPELLDIDKALAEVGPERAAKALSYRNELDRRLSLSAWLLLKRALHEEFGI